VPLSVFKSLASVFKPSVLFELFGSITCLLSGIKNELRCFHLLSTACSHKVLDVKLYLPSDLGDLIYRASWPPGTISSPPYANWAWQTPLSDDLDLNFNLQLPLTDLSLLIPYILYGTSHYRKWCLLCNTNLYLPRWYHASTVPANSAAQPSCIYSKLI
jgi:hypothetical protein